MADRYRTAHLSKIATLTEPEPGNYEWKPIRHALGIRAFGVNGFVAKNAGDCVIEEHTEVQDNAARHEELYVVAAGHATFSVAGEEIDAPAGTLVFVGDPTALRTAHAVEPGTTVLVVGGEPGVAYSVSGWEQKYLP